LTNINFGRENVYLSERTVLTSFLNDL